MRDKLLRPLALLMLILAAFVANAQTRVMPLSGYSLQIASVDDYDVTSGQATPVDPNGFDVKIQVTHQGQISSQGRAGNISPSDQELLGSSVIRFHAYLYNGEDVLLPTLGTVSASGDAYCHIQIPSDVFAKLNAANDPDVSLVATLTPRSASIDTRYQAQIPTSDPVRLTFNVSPLRKGQQIVPYLYHKVGTISLAKEFAQPVRMQKREAAVSGDMPAIPAKLDSYLWLRYCPTNSEVEHFRAIDPGAAGKWRVDLSDLEPGDYKLTAFASPHWSSSTFAMDGWRSDMYALSPETTLTILAPTYMPNGQTLSVLLALAFLGAAAMIIFRKDPPTNPSTDPSTMALPYNPTTDKRKLSTAAKSHKFLACVLLAIAVITVINYYDFFTSIVASALRGDAVTGQDWNLQNSGGISLLIMSYSISLGLCVELSVFKIIMLRNEWHVYGGATRLLYAVWIGAAAFAVWCAYAFIIHIGAFYSANPAMRELGHLAGSSELVIFFVAVAALMPMEHESWPERPQAPADGGGISRVRTLFQRRNLSPTAVVHDPGQTSATPGARSYENRLFGDSRSECVPSGRLRFGWDAAARHWHVGDRRRRDAFGRDGERRLEDPNRRRNERRNLRRPRTLSSPQPSGGRV